MTATIVSPDTIEAAPARRTVRPIPTTRLVKVELRKMFNTRSGFWMLVSIGVLSVIATGAVLIFAPDDAVTYKNLAIGDRLPDVGDPADDRDPGRHERVEPTQRTHDVHAHAKPRTRDRRQGDRDRPGGSRLHGRRLRRRRRRQRASVLRLVGVDTVWDISVSIALQMVLGDLIGMAIGFTLGVVLRNSPAAIVGYFVVSFVISGILLLLALVRPWFEDLQPWVDWNVTQVHTPRRRHEHR